MQKQSTITPMVSSFVEGKTYGGGVGDHLGRFFNDTPAMYSALAGGGIGAIISAIKQSRGVAANRSRKNKIKNALLSALKGAAVGGLAMKVGRRAAGRVLTNVVQPMGYGGATDELKAALLEHPGRALTAIVHDKPLYMEKDRPEVYNKQKWDKDEIERLPYRLPLWDAFFNRPITRGYVDAYRISPDLKHFLVNPHTVTGKALQAKIDSQVNDAVKEELDTAADESGKFAADEYPTNTFDGPHVFDARVYDPIGTMRVKVDPQNKTYAASDLWDFSLPKQDKTSIDIGGYGTTGVIFPRWHSKNPAHPRVSIPALLRLGSQMTGRPAQVSAVGNWDYDEWRQ
jgi:hypothetical protein